MVCCCKLVYCWLLWSWTRIGMDGQSQCGVLVEWCMVRYKILTHQHFYMILFMDFNDDFGVCWFWRFKSFWSYLSMYDVSFISCQFSEMFVRVNISNTYQKTSCFDQTEFQTKRWFCNNQFQSFTLTIHKYSTHSILKFSTKSYWCSFNSWKFFCLCLKSLLHNALHMSDISVPHNSELTRQTRVSCQQPLRSSMKNI